MTPGCLRDWYTEQQVREWLNREGWPLKKDLPIFLARHFQQALEKGWQLHSSVTRAAVTEALERAMKAQCNWCREELPVEPNGNSFVHRHPKFKRHGKGAKDDWIWCDAAAIRALKEQP